MNVLFVLYVLIKSEYSKALSKRILNIYTHCHVLKHLCTFVSCKSIGDTQVINFPLDPFIINMKSVSI